MEYQQADMLLPDTGTRPDTSSGGGVGVVVWWHIVGLSINTLVLVGFPQHHEALECSGVGAVSYTHLTLPTILLV